MENDEIDIFDYKKEDVENRTYAYPVKLVIKKGSYEKAKKEGALKITRATIYFSNVKFNSEVSINVDEGIEYEMSIFFAHCKIDSFSDFALESKDLGLHFENCIVGNLKISSGNLKVLQLVNCLGSFFVSKIKRVNIIYSERAIFPRSYKSIKTKKELNKLLSQKTLFHLTDIGDAYVNGREVSKKNRVKWIEQKTLKSNGKFKNYGIKNDKIRDYQLIRVLSREEKMLLNLNFNFIYDTENNNSKTVVSGLKLNSLSLSGKTTGEISIEDTQIENVYIDNFYPKANFSLYNVRPPVKKGKFEVNNSKLDNSIFRKVNFQDYFVEFHKSSFANTKFHSTTFPTVKELKNSNSISAVKNSRNSDEIFDNKTYNRDMYELFLELREALEKGGNLYESKKMNAIAYVFLFKTKGWNILESDFWNTKLVLGLNRLTNFHGISTRNAIVSFLVLTLTFHCLNLISFASIEFGYRSCDEYWRIFHENKRYVFAIANPTHRISSLGPEKEITGWTYFISFSSRILIGYTYYQFIAAFRRFR